MIKAINIEDEESWPKDLHIFLDEQFEQLSLYMQKELSYSELSYEDRGRFRNDYRSLYEDVLEETEIFLSGYYVSGYHCTRLFSLEIESVKKDGLNLLSQNFLEKKLQAAVVSQEITRDMANYILENNLSEKTWRKGFLHFTCSLEALKKEGGVGKFFKGWGGEAIYNIHENDNFSWNTIRKIGSPVVIEVALLPEDTFFNCGLVWTKIIDTFLENRDVQTENGKGTDARIKYSLPSDRILDIITIDNPKFLKLTSYDSWSTML